MGQSDEEIHKIIVAKVVVVIREEILEFFFGSIKTALIEEFDGHYGTVTQATYAIAITTIATTRLQRGEMMQ